MSKAKNLKALTAETLKQALWDTMCGLRDKTVKPDVANSTAAQAREIMRVVRTEIVIAGMNGGGKPAHTLLTFVKQAQ